MALPTEPGDGYLRSLAGHVRQHAAALGRASSPLALRLDPHHLYYLSLKFDELGIDAGPLDVRASVPARPPSGWTAGRVDDASDARSIFTSMSSLSLSPSGWSWWGSGTGGQANSLVEETKYLYSTFTKLPSVHLSPASTPSPSRPMRIVEGFESLPDQNSVPLTAFKSISSLALDGLDPRGFFGWDLVSQNLRSLSVRRSGLEDVERLLVDCVVDDVARRASRERSRLEAEAERSARLDAGPSPSARTPSPAPALPSLAWRFLRHLDLSDNALTFLPSSPLASLVSLSSLDLADNLLIAVPSGLSQLSSLRSLSLADNMVESVNGINQILGNVQTINLAGNRLTSLCGLDRLPSLQRVDLRRNRISESLELSRLSPLPHLSHLWASGNPFCKIEAGASGQEDRWRAKVWQYFVDEGRTDILDSDRNGGAGGKGLILEGATPSWSERRGLISRPGSAASRRSGSAIEPRVLERQGARKTVVRSPPLNPLSRPTSPVKPPSPSSAQSTRPTSPDVPPATASAAVKIVVGRKVNGASGPAAQRRRPARVVDLHSNHDAKPTTTATAAVTKGHLRHGSDPSRTTSPPASQHKFSSLTGTRPGPSDVVSAADIFNGSAFASSAAAAGSNGKGSSGFVSPEAAGDAFRKRVEELKREVGDGWLKVLGESEWGQARRSASNGNGDGQGGGAS